MIITHRAFNMPLEGLSSLCGWRRYESGLSRIPEVNAQGISPPVTMRAFLQISMTFLAVTLLDVARVSAALPLVRYNFDEPGDASVAVLNSGTAASADAHIQGYGRRINNTPNNFSARALDLDSGVTDPAKYASALTDTDVPEMDYLGALTVSFWVNMRAAPNRFDELADSGGRFGTGGFYIQIGDSSGAAPTASAFDLHFFVIGAGNSIPSAHGKSPVTYNANNQWTFVAMTYTGDTMQFFKGGAAPATTLTQLGSNVNGVAYQGVPANTGSDPIDGLVIGDSGIDGLSPPAWMDDFRVYGGVLSPSELETIRLGNIVATGSIWAVNGAGDWNSAAKWSGGIPNAINATANFRGAITSPRTVFTDIPVTVGTLVFNNASSYQIAGQGSLTLQVSGGSALVDVQAGTHKLNLPLIIASNTQLNVASGATLKISDPVTVNAGKSLSSIGAGTVIYQSTVTLLSGASISFASSQDLLALSVGSHATATLEAASASALAVDSVSVSPAGGKIDLKDNRMIFHNQGAGTWDGSAYDGVSGLIQRGYNGGDFLGSGIVTSMSGATDGSTLDRIGVVSNATLHLTMFGGQPVSATDTLVMYTLGGDANLDRQINADDYFQIDSGYARSSTGWFSGDFDYDGVISGDDYFVIDSAFTSQSNRLIASTGMAGVPAVPEPSSLGLMALGVLRIVFRRRH